VKKGQKWRKSLRRLKHTVGCNASKRRSHSCCRLRNDIQLLFDVVNCANSYSYMKLCHKTSNYVSEAKCLIINAFDLQQTSSYANEDCSLTFKNRVSYIGRAYRYPLNVAFYIYFQQIYVLSILNMLHTLRFSHQNAVYFIMLPFFWFLCYSHFTYRMC
jgi:hypothetical protein